MTDAVQQIKDRLSITEVLSSYIKLEKAGINWKAKCPFHNEKTPSFFVSSARQSYYCFGCGEKGDMFTFVQKFEGLDFKGALKSLADRAGIKIEASNLSSERKEEKERLYDLMEDACKFFEGNLDSEGKVGEYTKKRGLTDKTIKFWRLGFAKDEWRNLHDFLIKSGYARNELLKAGLIKKVDNEEKYYDTFRARLIFPICDTAGRVIAFSGRSLKEDDKTPKYLNSPETPLFYKSEAIHGLHVAKNYIRTLDYAVLVEGQMDLLLSHQTGVHNTVASSGTALTDLHLKKLSKLSNRIIIAYDGDQAGEKAALRAANIALKLGMETKIAKLPEGEDPASTALKSDELWKQTLRDSKSAIEFSLDRAIMKGGRETIKSIWTDVLPLVASIKSEIEKAKTVKEVAAKIGVEEQAVWSDMSKINSIDIDIDYQESKNKQNPSDLNRIMAGIVFSKEETSEAEKLKDEWSKRTSEQEVADILAFFSEDKELLIFETENNGLSEKSEEAFKDLLNRIELKSLKTKLKQTAIMLDSKISEEAAKEAEVEIKRIQERIKSLES